MINYKRPDFVSLENVRLLALAALSLTAASCSKTGFDSWVNPDTLLPIPNQTVAPIYTGTFSKDFLTNSVVEISTGSIAAGSAVTLKLILKDGDGNPADPGGRLPVFFELIGGTSRGTISGANLSGTGEYTAKLIGFKAGTPTSVTASVSGNLLATAMPAVQVLPGPASETASTLSAAATVGVGANITVTLVTKDAYGNNLTAGGAAVTFTRIGGTSNGTFGAVNDLGNGTYTVLFTGTAAGTATRIRAFIGGKLVTTSEPNVTVL